MTQVEQDLQASLDEAKEGDQQHTALAEKMMAAA